MEPFIVQATLNCDVIGEGTAGGEPPASLDQLWRCREGMRHAHPPFPPYCKMTMFRRPIIVGGRVSALTQDPLPAAEIWAITGGNTGNLAFRLGVATNLVNPIHMSLDAPAAAFRERGDVLVLPLANQLGAHTNLAHESERLRAIGLPVLALGLGAQAPSMEDSVKLNTGTLDWVREIASRSALGTPNIGMRGAFSLQQLDRLGLGGSARVIGCPSGIINVDGDLPQRLAASFKRRPRRVAVAAGIPFVQEVAALERELADIVTLTDGAYIVQHGLEMIQLATGEFDAMGDQLEACRAYIAPEATTEAFQAWCARHAWVMRDPWQWMDFLRRFDFVVGTRFHGVMLALQAGIPAGCIAHDSRTIEMCETMGVPVCRHTDLTGPITRHNVLDHFPFDAEDFAERRQALKASYVALLEGAGLDVQQRLR